mgnify:FL=1
MVRFAFVVTVSFLTAIFAQADLQERSYPGFKLWVDCSERLTKIAYYDLTKDSGNAKRPSGYKRDKAAEESCTQLSSKPYQGSITAQFPNDKSKKYDVGHIVNANHMDSSEEAIKASMYMVNMFPQVSEFNRQKGAWYYTELLSECLRDLTDLKIYAGTIIGSDSSDDYFVQSHGVRTPDWAWKAIYRVDTNSVQAYLMPNRLGVLGANVGDYLVSFNTLLGSLEEDESRAILEPLRAVSNDMNLWIVAGKNKLTCGGEPSSIE